MKNNDYFSQILFTYDEINQRIEELASELNATYQDVNEDILVIPIMDGSLVFASHIILNLDFTLHVRSTKISSYDEKTNSNHNPQICTNIPLDKIKQKIISKNMVDNIDSALSIEDITLSNVSRNIYSGLTCDVTIGNNKAYDASGNRVKTFTIKNVQFTGFKRAERGFFISNDGLNIYGIEKDKNNLWNIDRTAKNGIGDWAYNVSTIWLHPLNATINIDILAGYDLIKNKTVNQLRGSDYNELIYANIVKFYSILPDDFDINNLYITNCNCFCLFLSLPMVDFSFIF